MEIRRFEKGDGPQVAKLLKELNENSQFVGEDFIKVTTTKSFVAVLENKIIGFAALSFRYVPSHGKYTASVEDLIVLKEFNGKGVGSLLLNRLIQEAGISGLSTINLSSNNTRGDAQKLYEKKGFKRMSSGVYVLWI